FDGSWLLGGVGRPWACRSREGVERAAPSCIWLRARALRDGVGGPCGCWLGVSSVREASGGYWLRVWGLLERSEVGQLMSFGGWASRCARSKGQGLGDGRFGLVNRVRRRVNDERQTQDFPEDYGHQTNLVGCTPPGHYDWQRSSGAAQSTNRRH
ncbi:MAG: hypothetical protein INR71_04675, partial [Terriglobus roseus]|nr:hypothetical protein [Terriglobus roseus]